MGKALSFRELTEVSIDPGRGARRFASAQAVEVPVRDGTIQVYRIPPLVAGGTRPVVFVPGWGTAPEGFHALFASIPDGVELYYVETREKRSSRLSRSSASFTMDQFGEDLAAAMSCLDLIPRDPVLAGTCFGSAVIMHALSRRLVDVDTAVCFDPMVRLWVPRWVIRLFGPFVPPFLLWLLRPIIRTFVLAGMREPAQRARAAAFINSAEVWKWRRAAIATRDWSLFDFAGDVPQTVHVVNGSHDRFHDSRLFPDVASALPHGIFVRVPVDESRREQLMGLVAAEFAAQSGHATPEAITPFVSM